MIGLRRRGRFLAGVFVNEFLVRLLNRLAVLLGEAGAQRDHGRCVQAKELLACLGGLTFGAGKRCANLGEIIAAGGVRGDQISGFDINLGEVLIIATAGVSF